MDDYEEKEKQKEKRREERKKKKSALAREVLTMSRNRLLVHLRFLDMALNRLTPVETELFSLATDGRLLAYNPDEVLRNYQIDAFLCVKQYLHLLFHCIFQHMFVSPAIDRQLWNLACDIAVEAAIDDLGLPEAVPMHEEEKKKAYALFRKQIGQLTAERIYRFLKVESGGKRKKLSEEALENMRVAFAVDDHTLWYLTEKQKAAMGLTQPDPESRDRQENEESNAFMILLRDEECREEWKKISEKMQVAMETMFCVGDKGGNMKQNLREVNRERYDYTEFLRKFAVPGEIMRINDDEFDYIYYTYGMELYGNMPLIEPLEYKEVNRIREFVIAIDTSGSVSGPTVQNFIQKTYNILKSTESFFSKVNIHIIQCDAEIQEDAVITSQEDFDRYMSTMEIKGLGGTDYRTVFEYVDGLRAKGILTKMSGLIYFMDGFGPFPEKMPPYKTAFVFMENEMNNERVPSWGIKLILKEEDIA